MSDVERGDLVLTRIRRWLQSLTLIGAIGIAADLTLINHVESPQQFIPFVVLGLALIATGWLLASASRAAALACRLAMVAVIAAGLAGTVLHYEGSVEFQLESDPSAAGWALTSKVLESKAPPVLAPGNMIIIGLVGLVSTYKVEESDDN